MQHQLAGRKAVGKAGVSWNENRFGSLEVGKVADMVVLAEDPLTCDFDRLKDIRTERTFLAGRQVFGPS